MFSTSLNERRKVLGFNAALYTSLSLSSIWDIFRDSGVASNKVKAPLSPLKNLKIRQNKQSLWAFQRNHFCPKKLYQPLLLLRESLRTLNSRTQVTTNQKQSRGLRGVTSSIFRCRHRQIDRLGRQMKHSTERQTDRRTKLPLTLDS